MRLTRAFPLQWLVKHSQGLNIHSVSDLFESLIQLTASYMGEDIQCGGTAWQVQSCIIFSYAQRFPQEIGMSYTDIRDTVSANQWPIHQPGTDSSLYQNGARA